jgi:predicted ArsR family transcriptional regulator
MKRSSANLENSTSTIQSTADRLLLILKTGGPQTAIELGAALGMTDEAARQQMMKLAGEGLVEGSTEVRGVERQVTGDSRMHTLILPFS